MNYRGLISILIVSALLTIVVSLIWTIGESRGSFERPLATGAAIFAFLFAYMLGMGVL